MAGVGLAGDNSGFHYDLGTPPARLDEMGLKPLHDTRVCCFDRTLNLLDHPNLSLDSSMTQCQHLAKRFATVLHVSHPIGLDHMALLGASERTWPCPRREHSKGQIGQKPTYILLSLRMCVLSW